MSLCILCVWRSYEWYYNGGRLNTSNMTSSTHYMHNASVDGSLYLKMSLSKSSQGYYQCRAVNVAGVAMSNVSFVQEAGTILSLHLVQKKSDIFVFEHNFTTTGLIFLQFSVTTTE